MRLRDYFQEILSSQSFIHALKATKLYIWFY